MARPKKEGLDYFPLDVHFDEKIQALESMFGNDGLVWIIKFWQSAYRDSHGEVNLGGLFGSISAKNCRISEELQRDVLELCLGIGLISEISPDVYSSDGIKKRISKVSKERESALKRSKKSSSPKNPRKRGESKVKESKEKYLTLFESFWEIYPKRNGKKVGKSVSKKIWMTQNESDLETIIVNAKNYGVNNAWPKDPERFLKNEFWKDWDTPQTLPQQQQQQPQQRTLKNLLDD